MIGSQSQKEPTISANRQELTVYQILRNYLLRHIQTFFYTLGQLTQKPFLTMMTVMVIGIALSLPTGLNVLLSNFDQMLEGWGDSTQVSLFLHEDVSDKQAMALRKRIEEQQLIKSAIYISPEEALKEFKSHSGFGEALDALMTNPLPGVIVVTPEDENSDPASVSQILNELSQYKEVELAQIDMEWVKRLYAMMAIGERTVWVLATLLSIAVLLVIGNTIRLGIQNSHDEIIITKLIGATDAFIQRPFLYTGFWYGLMGSIIAIILIEIALLLIESPVEQLSSLYQSDFNLAGMDFNTILWLVVSGSMLGLIGSWIAVGKHLKEIEPT